MTLLDEMADYQQPPHITNQSMEKFMKKTDTEKLKNRLENYRARHRDMEVKSQPAVQAHYQNCQEQTKKYHEKWQQVKAKKSNKRQRDSTGSAAAGHLKRKLSTKADGPPNKQANADIGGVPNDDNESELHDLLIDGLDLELDASNNLSEIMTMLESDSSNASNAEHANNLYPTMHSQLHPNSDRRPPPSQQPQPPVRQQTPKQQPHMNNTPSPQSQQQLGGGVPGSIPAQQQQAGISYLGPAGHPANRQIPPSVQLQHHVKSERMPVTAPYGRSMSESTTVYEMAQRQHVHPMERQPSMPAEYTRGYTGQQLGKSLQIGGASPLGLPMPHDYGHQMSTVGAHNTQTGIPGAYYPSHMAAASGAGREYTHGGGATVPGYHGYASNQFTHPNMQMSPEQDVQLKMMKAAHMARSHSHSGVVPGGGYYMDPRGAQPAAGAYHPMMTASSHSAAALQHQAALRANSLHHPHQERQMVPGCSVQYMPGYPASMSSGGGKPPLMSRQLSVPGLLPHDSHLTTSKSVSNMQHPGGAMSHPTFQTSQPTMLGPATGASYPPAHVRMGPVNPAMMSQQQHSNAQLQSQHHMSRVQATNPSALGQNAMMVATHPSVNPHMMHRPPSAGAHQHIVPPHATSPTQPAVTPQPQSHYGLTHQQTMHHQAHQQHLSHMHGNIHPQHIQRQSMGIPQQQNQTPHPQQQHTPNQDPQQNHTHQFYDDLNDLNELLCGTPAL